MTRKVPVYTPVTDELLDSIPPGATRVSVQDVTGKKRWRRPGKILDTDKIAISATDGEPVVMFREPGRKTLDHPTLSTTRAPVPYKRKSGVKPNAPSKAVSNANKRRRFYSVDPLLKKALELGDDDDLLALAVREYAVEISTLGYERVEAEKANDSKSVSQLSIRRQKALQGFVDAYLKRQTLMEGRTIDLNSPAFIKLFGFIVETFQEVMSKSNVHEDLIEAVITELSARLEDENWIHEALASMRASS